MSLFLANVTFYHNRTFTQRQISTTLAEMSDLSPLWKGPFLGLFCASMLTIK